MAATNKKAEGVATPAAHISHCCDCDCACAAGVTQAHGVGTMNTFIGTALRHGRNALGLVLAYGPADHRVGRQLRAGREAFDRALWLTNYCETDR